MLTIGYGDLSPTNELEILAILPIQVIGISLLMKEWQFFLTSLVR